MLYIVMQGSVHCLRMQSGVKTSVLTCKLQGGQGEVVGVKHLCQGISASATYVVICEAQIAWAC